MLGVRRWRIDFKTKTACALLASLTFIVDSGLATPCNIEDWRRLSPDWAVESSEELDRLSGLAEENRVQIISESIRNKIDNSGTVHGAVTNLTDTELAVYLRVLRKKYPGIYGEIQKTDAYKAYRDILQSSVEKIHGQERARNVLKAAVARAIERRKLNVASDFPRAADDGGYRTVEKVPYALFDRSISELNDHFPREMLDVAQFEGKTLLDLGGGPKATFVTQLIDATQGRATAVSIDINADLSVNKTGRGVINLRQNFASLPFEDGRFDFIYSSYSLFFGKYFELHSKEFLLTVLSECRRVLKPGGVMRFSPVNEDLVKKLGRLPGLEVRRNGFRNGHWWVEIGRVELTTRD